MRQRLAAGGQHAAAGDTAHFKARYPLAQRRDEGGAELIARGLTGDDGYAHGIIPAAGQGSSAQVAWAALPWRSPDQAAFGRTDEIHEQPQLGLRGRALRQLPY